MRFRVLIRFVIPAFIVPLLVLAAEKGDPVRGKRVFSRCAICHGDSGEGNESIGKALGVTIKPLGSKEVQSLDHATMKKGILEGKGKMLPMKISDQEAEDVIAYIRTLKK